MVVQCTLPRFLQVRSFITTSRRAKRVGSDIMWVLKRRFSLFSIGGEEAMHRPSETDRGCASASKCDRMPIGCFVSGGVDSSLVAALVVRRCRCERRLSRRRVDFLDWSGGCGGSSLCAHGGRSSKNDASRGARDAGANARGHTGVIRDLETWDTATVRAATGHTLLASYIRDHTSVKVLFSGEGADEIMGSYLYFSAAPSPDAFQEESLRLCKRSPQI